MRTTLKQILEQLDRICEVLSSHNEILRLLLDESIARDNEKVGIFKDIDDDVQKFFGEAMKHD